MSVVMVLLVMTAVFASAYGGGGYFTGHYFPVSDLANTEIDAETSGGYGFGVSHDGARYGGFGMVIQSSSQPDGVIGAFGGFITGRQYRGWPFTVSANLWTGVGYVNPNYVSDADGFGFLAQADLEAGMSILPWFQLSLYAGMQVIGGFDLPSIVETALYTPVVGARLSWGSF